MTNPGSPQLPPCMTMTTKQARSSAVIRGCNTHMIWKPPPHRAQNTGTGSRSSTGHHFTMPGPCRALSGRNEDVGPLYRNALICMSLMIAMAAGSAFSFVLRRAESRLGRG